MSIRPNNIDMEKVFMSVMIGTIIFSFTNIMLHREKSIYWYLENMLFLDIVYHKTDI